MNYRDVIARLENDRFMIEHNGLPRSARYKAIVASIVALEQLLALDPPNKPNESQSRAGNATP